MTMADGKCGVCGRSGAIGVGSTLIPYSCAYCRECAEKSAQPAIVFETWYEEIGRTFSKMAGGMADHVLTYKDGKYVTYRQWAENYE